MRIKIETYRGVDIEFDTANERFVSIITDGFEKETASYSAVKKFIDEYRKTNDGFKPFFVVERPSDNMFRDAHKAVRVVGIRKDNRFIIEKEDGRKDQMSSHDEENYILFKASNESKFAELRSIYAAFDKYRNDAIAKRKEVIASMEIETLSDYKNKLI